MGKFFCFLIFFYFSIVRSKFNPRRHNIIERFFRKTSQIHLRESSCSLKIKESFLSSISGKYKTKSGESHKAMKTHRHDNYFSIILRTLIPHRHSSHDICLSFMILYLSTPLQTHQRGIRGELRWNRTLNAFLLIFHHHLLHE